MIKKLVSKLGLFKYFLVATALLVTLKAQSQAGKATTGTGLYKNNIFWLNWDLNGNGNDSDPIGNGAQRIFISASGIKYTATVSLVNGNPRSRNTYSFAGNNFPYGYGNIGGNNGAGNIVGITNGNDAQTASLRITVVAVDPYGNTGNATALLIAGTESLGGPNEYYQISTPAGVVRYLDKYIFNDIWANMSTQLQISSAGSVVKVTTPDVGNSEGDALLIAENVSYIDVEVKGGGLQHFAMGLIESVDFSDAPASYGKAVHVVNYTVNGGTFPDGNVNLSTTSNILDTDRGIIVLPALILGTIIDNEADYVPVPDGTNPNADDLTNFPDEDAIQEFSWPLCQATIKVKNTTPNEAYLSLWMDTNRNGVFDTDEKATYTVPAGTNGNVLVPLSTIAGLKTGNNYYTRIRLSSTDNLEPSGFAIDGEVEDHWVNIDPVITSSTSLVLCEGDTASFVGVTQADAIYSWTGPNGFVSTLQSPSIANIQLNQAGTYTLTLTYDSGCVVSDDVTVVVNPTNTVTVGSSTPTLCVNNPLIDITHTTTGATGIGIPTSLPAGVTATWSGNIITISGTPSAVGTFDYTIPLTGGCGTIAATGTIIVSPINTVTVGSDIPTLCVNTPLIDITHTTTGATGIGTPTSLPAGVTATWSGNIITISGTPSTVGTFDYTIPLTGGCGAVSATGTITVNPINTVTVGSSTPTLCVNTPLIDITHTTTGATGIGTSEGLPAGVIATWFGNIISISGTPSAVGTFDYTIPLTGGCGTIAATGTITVNPNNTVTIPSSTPTLCVNTPLIDITHTTTDATGIGTSEGLPAGVIATWSSNIITISGTPSAVGTFDYTIPLTGGCGTIAATGTITVNPNNTVTIPSSTPTLCVNTPLIDITHTTTDATGIGTSEGLPAGVIATWSGNIITISGTPSVVGTFDYTIPLTGGCGTVFATGTIVVSSIPNSPAVGLLTQPNCLITTGNVILNDLPLMGNWVIIATPATSGLTGLTGSGTITKVDGLVIGTTYQFQVENDLGCISELSNLVEINNVICAEDDSATVVNGKTGGMIPSVFDNDTLNGMPFLPTDVKVTTVVPLPNGLTLNPNGTITVDANTPVGNYVVEYTICQVTNPDICDTATKTIVVTTIVATDDLPTVINGSTGGTTPSVFDNDTLNGKPFLPADVKITTAVPLPKGLILNPNGTITVDANTPAGNYVVEYTICQVANPDICDTATKTVVVTTIDAVDDTPSIVDGIKGGTIPSVFDNDTLNGLPFLPADVKVTTAVPLPKGLTLNPNGTITVDANTPGGNYVVQYTICQVANPDICDTATKTVVVQVPSIALIKRAVFKDENGNGLANAGETITYKFKVTNTGNTPLKGIVITDPLPGIVLSGGPIDLDVNESDEYNFTGTYVITQSDINKGSVINQATARGESSSGVIVEDLSDDENNTEKNPTVVSLVGCEVKVFNAFSPNGDNINSRFYIQGIECYPENTVEIYNRWGILVFSADKYNNEDHVFRGFSEGRTTIKKSERLPSGTYFYIVKYKDSGSSLHEMAGYLYIN